MNGRAREWSRPQGAGNVRVKIEMEVEDAGGGGSNLGAAKTWRGKWHPRGDSNSRAKTSEAGTLSSELWGLWGQYSAPAGGCAGGRFPLARE